MKNTIAIKWSEIDQCFLVFLPECKNVMQPITHGDSYEEALRNAQEVIELITESEDSEDEIMRLAA